MVVALQAVMLDGDDGDLAATTVTYYLSTVRGCDRDIYEQVTLCHMVDTYWLVHEHPSW
jgi:hypothetical protein